MEKLESGAQLAVCFVLASLWLIFRQSKWRRNVHLTRRHTSNGEHVITFQKREFFITTSVRTSNPTMLQSVCYCLWQHI
jgi:hypothetical protein